MLLTLNGEILITLVRTDGFLFPHNPQNLCLCHSFSCQSGRQCCFQHLKYGHFSLIFIFYQSRLSVSFRVLKILKIFKDITLNFEENREQIIL